MQKRKITIENGQTLNAALTAKLVQTANEFDSKVYLEYEEKCLNAKSIMGMMSLHVRKGDAIDVIADGPDESEVLDRLEEFFMKECR